MSIAKMGSWNLQLWLQFNELSNTELGEIGTPASQATPWEKEVWTHVNLVLKMLVWLQEFSGTQET